MASGNRRRRQRSRVKPWLIIFAILIILAAVVVGIVMISKVAPSNEVTDLEYYYNLKINALENRDAAAPDELAIVLEDQILSQRAFRTENAVYISHSIVQGSIDERFYYDSNEGLLIVTNAEQTVTAAKDNNYYDIDGTQVSLDHPVFTDRKGEIFISLDFVDTFSNATYEVFENPSRVVINYKTGEKTFCDVIKKTQVRVLGGPKSEVVGTVEKDSKLLVLDDLEDWLKVVSPEGWLGYVSVSAVSDKYKEDVAGDYDEPEYTSMRMNGQVKLAWAGLYSTDANSSYYSLTSHVGNGINVYSPTWYFLDGADGTVKMLSDTDYVSDAHADGYQVWALFSDEDYDNVEYVLTHTSLRHIVEDAVIADMLEKGIDGLNVDFERIMSAYGNDFIQFIRELSIRCRKEGLFLSVDNYTPYDYNACYHIEEQSRLCDYVIIMAYDDYLGTGEIGPNSSLPFIREAMDLSISKVDESKLVCALPFYSRFWFRDSEGVLSRTEYTMPNAWELLSQVGVEASWDDESGVYYAEYEVGSRHAYAWAEDEDTLRAKLDLVTDSYNLGGIAFWQLGQEYNICWEVISEY